MDCPLCGADNPDNQSHCRLCDAPLGESQPQSQTSPRPQKKSRRGRIALLLGLIALAAGIPWLLLLDLYQTPETVSRSREEFYATRSRYLKASEMWNQRKNQLLTQLKASKESTELLGTPWPFDNVPTEMLMALLLDDLDFQSDANAEVCLYPIAEGPSPTFLLSKLDDRLKPVRSVVSLLFRLVRTEGRWTAEPLELRRGKRVVSTDNAWAYFAEEFRHLRQLEPLATQLGNVAVIQSQDPDTGESSLSLKVDRAA